MTSMILNITGGVLIAITAFDLLVTVLHPNRSGPLSRVVTAVVWKSTLAIGSRVGSGAIVGFGGSFVMLGQLLAWVLGFWLGFALIYTGYFDYLAFSPSVEFGNGNFVDAMYLSGAALTTVGFGDLVAESDLLRLVTVVEAASGLALITAAVSYLLSVYPLASQVRVLARTLAPAGEGPRAAAEFVYRGGPSQLDDLRRRLIEFDESTQRFPALYYFHANDRSASLSALIRAASLIVMQLRFGVSSRAMPQARWAGEQLDATLAQVILHFETRFFGHRVDRGTLPADSETQRRLLEVRRAAAEVTGIEADDEVDRNQLAEVVARSNSFLAELERRHLYDHEPL